MKKLLTFALLATVGVANAASINWNYNFGTRTIKDSDGNKLTGTAYLILADDLADIQAAADPSDPSAFLDALNDAKLDSIGISGGKSTSTTGTASDSDLVAGTEYDFQVLIYDTAKNQYYVSTSKRYAAYDGASDDPALAKPVEAKFSGAELGATTGSNPNTNEWSSATPSGVPEPATGALALAGIALLFKRRKA